MDNVAWVPISHLIYVECLKKLRMKESEKHQWDWIQHPQNDFDYDDSSCDDAKAELSDLWLHAPMN